MFRLCLSVSQHTHTRTHTHRHIHESIGGLLLDIDTLHRTNIKQQTPKQTKMSSLSKITEHVYQLTIVNASPVTDEQPLKQTCLLQDLGHGRHLYKHDAIEQARGASSRLVLP
jgi:hypothetical protein